MINVEGKKKSDFRIKNLKLYYKDELVDVVTKWLSTFKCALINGRSVCSLDKRYELLKLCAVNSISLVFLTETWLNTDIKDSEIFLGSSFKIILE